MKLIDRPRKWDTDFIKKFMLTFGAVSSIFDFLTFGVLLFILGATMTQFRTRWLLISVLTEVIIVFIIRTRKPFFRSRPSRYLLAATAFIALVTLVFPYTPVGGLFELVPLPVSYILPVVMILGGYIVLTESVKRVFYQYVKY
ncbi:magnesium-transporting P-type ATPase [Haloferax prahovense DSM 18310]|uniref:Magnesium-transporting P-type ATPase n=1 Tax=Haloferax prahovense (strain DSM 18310 / JCM 13924 / TL6) TaxID=1227461 RepID=M0G8J5_HALPT|nr:magnesium-transporting P-type ATPase [Haloferax prahovense DSM 18310]